MKKIFGIVTGKTWTQPLFEMLFKVGLYGMNVGGTSDLQKNGELQALRYVRNKTNKKPIVFDVGANVGRYTEAILSTLDEVEIHAFEPLQNNFKRLTDKYGGNSKVVFIQKGIGAQKTKSTIYFNPELGSMASVYERKLEHHNFEINNSETIELVTLDGYCAENNIQKIDFLKLDIEGHELAALKGSANLLKQNKIQFIQFEFGGSNIDSRTFFQDFWYLLSPQYKIYRIVKNGLKEIKTYNENNEIFGYLNYFAELR